MSKNLIIVYGGAFNPPSLAHVTLTKQLLESTGAKKLLFIPVGDHYKKKGLIPAYHRVNMLKLVCNRDSRLFVNTIEIDSKERLYTIQTLDKLKEQYPKDNLCFVMGTDNLRDILNWKDWERILMEYKILVMNRGQDTLLKVLEDIPVLKKYKYNIIQAEGLIKTTISSTIIRDNIKNRKNIGHLTTIGIIKYINKEKLYLD